MIAPVGVNFAGYNGDADGIKIAVLSTHGAPAGEVHRVDSQMVARRQPVKTLIAIHATTNASEMPSDHA